MKGIAMFLTKTNRRLLTCVLAILMALPVVALAQQPPDQQSEEQLYAQFQDAYRIKKYKIAIKVGNELVKLSPSNDIYAYNLACVYALDEKTISASKWLKKAAKLGFSDYAKATNDEDLVSIRTDPGYIEAIKLIRKNQDEGKASFARRAGKSEPLIYLSPGHVRTAAAPVVIVMHGWGTNAEDIAGPWRETADEFGLILVAPRAIRKAQGTNGFTWGTLEEAETLVLAAYDKVLKEYRVDKQRVVLCGFSQGGSMTYAIGVRHPDKFCGIIPMAGRYDPSIRIDRNVAPAQYPKVFIMVGDKDEMLFDSQRAAHDLETAGFKVKLRVYEGVGHALPDNYREEFRKALQWFWPN